jgi:hypothetical protein
MRLHFVGFSQASAGLDNPVPLRPAGLQALESRQCVYELPHRFQKLLRLINERHVAAGGQDNQLRSGNFLLHFFRHFRIAFIVVAHDDQRWNLNFGMPVVSVDGNPPLIRAKVVVAPSFRMMV